MTSVRVRTFLGVYAPLIVGALLIVLAVNFLVFTASGPSPWWHPEFSWDVWRAACAGGLIFVGIILGISTLGRARSSSARRRAWGRWYRKREEERTEPPGPETPPPKGE